MADQTPNPCPYCGAEAKIGPLLLDHVSCANPKCFAVGPIAVDDPPAAIAAWNRVAGAVQRLERVRVLLEEAQNLVGYGRSIAADVVLARAHRIAAGEVE